LDEGGEITGKKNEKKKSTFESVEKNSFATHSPKNI